MQIGDECEASIEKLVYGSDGLARIGDLVLFIPQAAPGDRARVRITAIERNYYKAEIVEILEPSPLRRTAPCSYFGTCGGCQLQHLQYNAQLAAKAEFIRDSLARIGRIKWPMPIEIKHAAEFEYRSRAQFKIDRNSSPLKIGFYKAGSREVCDVERCPILAEPVNGALRMLRASADEIASAAAPYSKIEVSVGDQDLAASPEAAGLKKRTLEKSVLGIKYRFDPECFFQVNGLLLEKLVETVLADRSGELAVDLYAGVGLFALQLAGRYKRALATEVNPRAVSWAERNIRANGLENVEFASLSAEKWLSRLRGADRGSRSRKAKIRNPRTAVHRIDLVVLDPPRAGASRKVIAELIELKPTEIVYVSCDPTTLARDLQILTASGYRLDSVIGIDLFPQTYHIETIASLKL